MKKMKMMKYVLPVIAAGFAASSAQAALTFNVTSDAVTVPGFVINVITVDSDSDLTAVGATSQGLTAGQLNQVTFGSFVPAATSNIGNPADSFLSINGDGASVLQAGGGVNTGGGTPAIFNDNQIDATWNDLALNDIGTGMHVATLVFSVSANGTFSMIATNAAGDGPTGFQPANALTVIQNGFLVPEPASLALMGLGGLAALRRRR